MSEGEYLNDETLDKFYKEFVKFEEDFTGFGNMDTDQWNSLCDIRSRFKHMIESLINERKKLDTIYSNGCFTGDCDHDQQFECDRAMFSFMNKTYQDHNKL